MGVPPANQPPGSTPPSDERSEGPSHHRKHRKDFSLNRKKEDEEEKKKSLFDIAGGEKSQEIKQEIEEGKMSAEKGQSAIQSAEAKASVAAIGKLIQSTVTDLKIGQIDGKNFASMNLSNAGEIPQAFAGSNLTLSYQAGALIIHFDNFMSPQQENQAITLVEKNKEQLLEMVQTLQAKNITVHEMTIGTHVVALPRVEPLPPPFQSVQTGLGQTRQEREQQQEEGGEEGAGSE